MFEDYLKRKRSPTLGTKSRAKAARISDSVGVYENS